MTATLASAVANANPLLSEAQHLRQSNYQRGHPSARLVAALVEQGYARVALAVGDVRRGRQFAFSTVADAEKFTRPRAPQHFRRIQGLFAVLAVALVTGDARFAASFADTGHFSPDQCARLRYRYTQLSRAQVEWAQSQIAENTGDTGSQFPVLSE